MNGDFNSIDDACKAAGTTLAAIFTDIVLSDDCDFENVEQICLKAGHKIMADAFSKALENLDEKLCSSLPEGTHIKDRRNKTLVTTMGDVTFKQRRCIDEYGNSVYPHMSIEKSITIFKTKNGLPKVANQSVGLT